MISGGATVDGFGFALTATPGGAASVANNGAVNLTAGAPTAGGDGALGINASGSLITYTGAGTIDAANFGPALVMNNIGAGGVTATIDGTVNSVTGAGVLVTTDTGTVTLQGSGAISGGVDVQANGAGNVNVIGSGAISGGVIATSGGGNILIATTSTISGGIDALTSGNGSLTVTTGGAVTGAGIITTGQNGGTTINVGHNVGNGGIDVLTSGGAIEINHTAGTISGTTVAIIATTSGGSIAISQTGGALNGPTFAIDALAEANGNVIVSLTGGTVGSTSNNVIGTSAEAGTTTITTNVNLTSTAGRAISATSTSGDITIQGSATVQGSGNAVNATSTSGNIRVLGLSAVGGIHAVSTNGTVGVTATSSTNSYTVGGVLTAVLPGGTINALSTSGINVVNAAGFVSINNFTTITNAGNALAGSAAAGSSFFFANQTGAILNGNINVTGSNVATSGFANSGTWNTAATGNSTFSGTLGNSGTFNSQNASSGQIVTLGGDYLGGGAYRIDLGDRINAAGTASLTGGNANVRYLAGTPVAASNVIFRATGGLGGTTFGTVTTSGFNNFNVSVVYTPTDVLLNLSAMLGVGGNLNGNQQNIVNTLNSFFNGGGVLSPGFATVFGLTGNALANALSQLSGEVATGIQPSANLSMGMFLNTMIDPFVTGRSGGFGSAMNYAPEQPSRVEIAAREAFAADMPVKARPPVATFEQRWSMWGAAYGGQNRTDGDLGRRQQRPARHRGGLRGRRRLSRVARHGDRHGGGGRAGPLERGGAGARQGPLRRWAGRRLCLDPLGQYVSLRRRGVRVAQGRDRAHGDGRRHRSPERRLRRHQHRRASRRRLSLRRRAIRSHALRRGAGAVAAHARLQRRRRRNNQFALTFASQTTTDTRSELGFWADTRFPFAEQHGRAARPRRLGARLQSGKPHQSGVPDVAGREPSPSTARQRRAMRRSPRRWRRSSSAAAGR